MIKINITEDQIKRAKELYPFNALNGSITKGASNLYGALGEIIVHDYYFNKHKICFNSTYDYDLIINDFKVDVKTKKTSVIPKYNYLCSISTHNTKQDCDYYYFVRININLKSGYLLGYIKKNEFYKNAFFRKKGDKDINDFIFKDDCYNIEIHKLNIK